MELTSSGHIGDSGRTSISSSICAAKTMKFSRRPSALWAAPGTAPATPITESSAVRLTTEKSTARSTTTPGSAERIPAFSPTGDSRADTRKLTLSATPSAARRSAFSPIFWPTAAKKSGPEPTRTTSHLSLPAEKPSIFTPLQRWPVSTTAPPVPLRSAKRRPRHQHPVPVCRLGSRRHPNCR